MDPPIWYLWEGPLPGRFRGHLRGAHSLKHASTHLQCAVLTKAQKMQVMNLYVSNLHNAVFLDNLVELLPNNPEARLLTDRFDRPATENAERRIPSWMCTSVPPRHMWAPVLSQDDIQRLFKLDPYKKCAMGYMFHFDKACTGAVPSGLRARNSSTASRSLTRGIYRSCCMPG